MSDHSQPKWAWWVVGIVLPVIGIVVTIWAAGGLWSGGGDGSAEAATGAARSPSRTAAAPGGSAPGIPPQASEAADTPPRVLTRSVGLVLEPGLQYLDLDTVPPMAMPSAAGADLVALFDGRQASLVPEGPTATVARLPQSAYAATPAECTAALAKYGSRQASAAAVGARYCVATDEGHVAYVEIELGVPVEPHVRMAATVWE